MPMACATASNASSTKSSITAGSQRATKRRHAIFSRWSCSPPLWSGCETWSKCQQDLALRQPQVLVSAPPQVSERQDRRIHELGSLSFFSLIHSAGDQPERPHLECSSK